MKVIVEFELCPYIALHRCVFGWSSSPKIWKRSSCVLSCQSTSALMWFGVMFFDERRRRRQKSLMVHVARLSKWCLRLVWCHVCRMMAEHVCDRTS